MIRRWPLTSGLALAFPLALAGAIAVAALAGGGSRVWAALHACARLGATVLSLPALLALALAASILGLGLWHGLRQGALSARALRLAARHQVPAPLGVAALAARLGAPLVVVELPGELAYCAGLVRPRVVLSRTLIEALGPAALEAVLAHEATHARRRDPLRQVLAHAAAQALWFAPLATALAARQRLRIELAADAAARCRVGRRALAEALLTLHGPTPAHEGPAFAGGTTLLERRIDALAATAPPALALPAGWLRPTLVGATLTGLLVLLAFVMPAVGPEPLMPMPMDGSSLAGMVAAWLVRLGAIALAAIAVRALMRARARLA